MITQEYLKSILDYNPETGNFIWKERPRSHFKNKTTFGSWRTRFVGRVAGTDDGRGYIRIKVNGKITRAHRLAWLYMRGVWPKDQLDHINHKQYDNRIVNLREARNSDNQKNTPMYANNSSGFMGVSWNRSHLKWVSMISDEGKQIYLGTFKQLSDAVYARVNAEKKYGYHQNHGIERGDTN